MFILNWLKNKSYRAQIQQYYQERMARLNSLRQELTPKFAAIDSQLKQTVLNSTVYQLVELLNSKKTNSQTILLVFIEQNYKHGFRLNNAVQQNFKESLEKARNCDIQRQKTGLANWTFQNPDPKALPPLFGVPISIKQSFFQAGTRTTVGCTYYLNKINQEDGYVVMKLKRGGAIPFVRSNVPQSLMTYQSINPIYGRALNPWNQERTSGGSSGGEGGLISSRCSPLGLGSDVGGSIRAPAQFCGITGLKPTPGRLPSIGQLDITPCYGADRVIPFVIGPLARSPKDLAIAMQVLLSPQFEDYNPDPFSPMRPFDLKQFNSEKKGKVGYFKSARVMPAGPSAQRAVEEAVAAARALGYQVEEIEFPQFQRIFYQYLQTLAFSGLQIYDAAPHGQYIIDEYSSMRGLIAMPSWLRFTLSKVIGLIYPRASRIMNVGYNNSLQLITLLDSQKQLQIGFTNFLRAKGIQFIIAPSYTTRALKHGFSKDGAVFGAYLIVWNYLRLPSVVVPITRCRPEQQVYETVHGDMWDRLANQNEEGAAGMPAGVQLVGWPFAEERLLGFADALDKQVGFRRQHNYPL